MIDTNELRGIIAKNGLSQSELARKLGMTPKTFYDKMKKGVFSSNEIEKMIVQLGIENPIAIFFVNNVT
nr:MAG TPA: response regulator [Caudoviricetes sp.]